MGCSFLAVISISHRERLAKMLLDDADNFAALVDSASCEGSGDETNEVIPRRVLGGTSGQKHVMVNGWETL